MAPNDSTKISANRPNSILSVVQSPTVEMKTPDKHRAFTAGIRIRQNPRSVTSNFKSRYDKHKH